MILKGNAIQFGKNNALNQITPNLLKESTLKSTKQSCFNKILSEAQRNRSDQFANVPDVKRSMEPKRFNYRQDSNDVQSSSDERIDPRESEEKTDNENVNAPWEDNLTALLRSLNILSADTNIIQAEADISAKKGSNSDMVLTSEVQVDSDLAGINTEQMINQIIKEIDVGLEGNKDILDSIKEAGSLPELQKILTDLIMQSEGKKAQFGEKLEKTQEKPAEALLKPQNVNLAGTRNTPKSIDGQNSSEIRTDGDFYASKSGNEDHVKNEAKAETNIVVEDKNAARKTLQKVLQKVVLELKETVTNTAQTEKPAQNIIEKANAVQQGAPLYKTEVLKQIVEKARVLVNGDKSEMDMQLRPDNLGKLSLKVAVEKGLMTARFVAESNQVKEIIESNFNQLKDMLQQKGIDVQSFSVSVGQDGSNFKNSHNFDAWREAQKTSRISKLSLDFDEEIKELAVNNEISYYHHEGSIDYKA